MLVNSARAVLVGMDGGLGLADDRPDHVGGLADLILAGVGGRRGADVGRDREVALGKRGDALGQAGHADVRHAARGSLDLGQRPGNGAGDEPAQADGQQHGRQQYDSPARSVAVE